MYRVVMLLASLGLALLALSATGAARADMVRGAVAERSIAAF